MFENEKGRIIEQVVIYEWKLILCIKCNNFGHSMTECRRNVLERRKENKVNIEGQHAGGQEQLTGEATEWRRGCEEAR